MASRKSGAAVAPARKAAGAARAARATKASWRSAFGIAMVPKLWDEQQKSPTRKWGLKPHPLSRRVSANNDPGGFPDSGCPLRGTRHSGGTVADFHGLPPQHGPAECCEAVYAGARAVSIEGKTRLGTADERR